MHSDAMCSRLGRHSGSNLSPRSFRSNIAKGCMDLHHTVILDAFLCVISVCIMYLGGDPYSSSQCLQKCSFRIDGKCSILPITIYHLSIWDAQALANFVPTQTQQWLQIVMEVTCNVIDCFSPSLDSGIWLFKPHG